MRRLLAVLPLLLCLASPAIAQTCPAEAAGALSTDGKIRVVTVTGTAGTGTGTGTLNKRVADLRALGWLPVGTPTSTTAQLWCALATTPPPVPPPLPVDCVVSPFTTWQPTSEWGACTAGQQTRTEARSRTILTVPSNGGLSCPALTETRTASQTCTTPIPVPPPAGNVFQNGWEGQTGTGCGLAILKDGTVWNDYGPSITCNSPQIAEISVIPGRLGALSRALVVTFRPDGTQNGPDFRIDRGLPQNYTDLYAAWDFGYSPNWVFAGADHKVVIFGNDQAGQTQNVYYNIRGNGNGPCGRVAIHVISSDTVLSDPDVQVCPGWHRGEIRIVGGTTGRIEAKLNGRLLNLRTEAGRVVNPLSFNTGAGTNYFKLDTTYNLYSYPSGLGLTMQMWFDNIALATGGWIGQ